MTAIAQEDNSNNSNNKIVWGILKKLFSVCLLIRFAMVGNMAKWHYEHSAVVYVKKAMWAQIARKKNKPNDRKNTELVMKS